MHARRGEQDRRVVGRGHQRAAGQPLVIVLGEERQEGLADLVGGHPAIVAHPTMTSPARSTAVWPGAGALNGAPSNAVSPSIRQGTGAARERSLTASTASGARCRRTPRRATASVCRASRGPTVTVLARASVRTTYSGSGAWTPRPRRWPTV